MAAAAKAKKRDRISFEPTSNEQIALDLLSKNLQRPISWIIRDSVESYLVLNCSEIWDQAARDNVELPAEFAKPAAKEQV